MYQVLPAAEPEGKLQELKPMYATCCAKHGICIVLAVEHTIKTPPGEHPDGLIRICRLLQNIAIHLNHLHGSNCPTLTAAVPCVTTTPSPRHLRILSFNMLSHKWVHAADTPLPCQVTQQISSAGVS